MAKIVAITVGMTYIDFQSTVPVIIRLPGLPFHGFLVDDGRFALWKR